MGAIGSSALSFLSFFLSLSSSLSLPLSPFGDAAAAAAEGAVLLICLTGAPGLGLQLLKCTTKLHSLSLHSLSLCLCVHTHLSSLNFLPQFSHGHSASMLLWNAASLKASTAPVSEGEAESLLSSSSPPLCGSNSLTCTLGRNRIRRRLRQRLPLFGRLLGLASQEHLGALLLVDGQGSAA